ncbi:MAG: MurR/RpiR family transcriptional regulator [Eubacterium sp.]|jgi:DNA-binding MurR/RpiR family transcriptional regulator|nr:MurR/RpiR family transcriptional regulator [Eubacterium sp.]
MQEKKIANYIMKDHAGVINMMIGELADACGTSVATVSRFCRKCGVDGFHQLKIMLAKEMADSGTGMPVSNHISRTQIGQSLQNILANKIEEIRQTISLIDEKLLNTILDYYEPMRKLDRR